MTMYVRPIDEGYHDYLDRNTVYVVQQDIRNDEPDYAGKYLIRSNIGLLRFSKEYFVECDAFGREIETETETESCTNPDEKKDTNPKIGAGSTKVPLHLFPSTAIAAGSVAFHEGSVKYGTMNWRRAGVRYSVYQAAVLRHLMSAWEGETIDPTCGIDHLGKAIACLAIIIDARAAGVLEDDRCVSGGYEKLIEELTPTVNSLTELHKNKTPYHYSIKD